MSDIIKCECWQFVMVLMVVVGGVLLVGCVQVVMLLVGQGDVL